MPLRPAVCAFVLFAPTTMSANPISSGNAAPNDSWQSENSMNYISLISGIWHSFFRSRQNEIIQVWEMHYGIGLW